MSTKNTRNVKRSQKQKMIPKGLKPHSEKPIDMTVQAIRSFKLRTQASSSYTDQITWRDFSAMVGIIATGSTTSVCLSSCIRLKTVEIWAPVQTAGTAVTASVSWLNSALDFESPPVTHSDSSISFDHPAYLCLKPPKGSISSKWHRSDDDTLVMDLRCPTGTTIDWLFDWVLSDSLTIQAQIAGPTISGGTVGVVYHKTITGSSGTLVIINVLNGI